MAILQSTHPGWPIQCEQGSALDSAADQIKRRRKLLSSFLSRDARALFSSFREPNSNGLLAALHLATLASFSRAQSTALAAAHRARYSFAGTFAVLTATRFFLCWHRILLPIRTRFICVRLCTKWQLLDVLIALTLPFLWPSPWAKLLCRRTR